MPRAMPLSLRRGTVTALVEQHDELIRIEVDGAPCVAYPRVTGPVGLGDEVLVNFQARELGLGSGGFDVLYANLTRGLELEPQASAHVMALPYTPLQHAVVHAEEAGTLAPSLDGMPVVCCSLHSQLAPVCGGIGRGVRVAYVQLAGGALPVSLSDAVRVLREKGLVAVAIAASPCHDGDVQCANVASALAWAGARGYDAVVCSVGPGIVGTGSNLGHGALSAVEAANTVTALSGSPVIAARYSDADARDRHRGLSHHTRAVVELCLGEVAVAWPAGLEAPAGLELDQLEAGDWRDACAGLPLEHMGRGPDEDPWFFATAFAAGRVARRLV
jgi:Protein of unknown function (DUF3866)